ncbi:MAG: Ig-like domain-containing protein [Lachnospiraceae bacterium]|nr:Ig-like domain-containing protein [Lachnospiraceae bacterium]
MRNVKKRIAVFLSIMLIFPAIMNILPVATTEVSAASNVWMYWKCAYGYKTIEVEQGEKFYIGDYVNVSTPKIYTVASLVNASYSSSKKSVATVDKNGLLEAVSTGTTKITVKYKGKKLTTKLKVVKDGKFGNEEMIADVKGQLALLEQAIPKKVTLENGFECLQMIEGYKKYIDEKEYYLEYNGILEEREKISGSNWYTYKAKNKLAVPQAGRYYYLEALLGKYSGKNSPVATRSSKVLKVKSVSAKPSMVTIKLKKKVDASQILAARIIYDNDWLKMYNNMPELTGDTKAYISVGLYSTNGGASYFGIAELTKGSKVAKLYPMKYSSKKYKYVKAKLKKGATYNVGGDYSWTKGKKVKVK